MLIVHIHVQVKPEYIDAFKEVTIENARNSLAETGIVRFDVIHRLDDTTKFILVEVYRTQEDPARHKETPHYARWRDAVVDMMAEPRKSIKFANIFPDEDGW